MSANRPRLLASLEQEDWKSAYGIFFQDDIWPWIVADAVRASPSEFGRVLMGASQMSECRLFGIWADHLIGFCGLREIEWTNRTGRLTAYAIREPRRGFPAMTMRAMRELLAYGFQSLGLNRIDVEVLASNKPVLAILERLGFRQEGVMRQRLWSAGAFHDVWICAMLRTDYLARMEAKRHARRHPDVVVPAGGTQPTLPAS